MSGPSLPVFFPLFLSLLGCIFGPGLIHVIRPEQQGEQVEGKRDPIGIVLIELPFLQFLPLSPSLSHFLWTSLPVA